MNWTMQQFQRNSSNSSNSNNSSNSHRSTVDTMSVWIMRCNEKTFTGLTNKKETSLWGKAVMGICGDSRQRFRQTYTESENRVPYISGTYVSQKGRGPIYLHEFKMCIASKYDLSHNMCWSIGARYIGHITSWCNEGGQLGGYCLCSGS